jgi:hypothetical protein
MVLVFKLIVAKVGTKTGICIKRMLRKAKTKGSRQ